jgi:hypothetical protein
MSDTVFKLIPENPRYVPDQESRIKAKEYLATLFPEAEDVVDKVRDKIDFIDAGTNLETITCPNCLSRINMDWWQLAMKQAAKNQFANLTINTPCCGDTLSLNDLQYHWTAGFARYSLEVRNPGKDVDDRVNILEDTLGTMLRKIWAHYY